MRLRLLFEKRGWAAFIRHVEVPQLFGRMARRAGLTLEFTQGFSPHPHIVMGPALPVGVLGLREATEIFFARQLTATEVVDRLNAVSPQGIRFLRGQVMGEGPGLGKAVNAATYLFAPRNRSLLSVVEAKAREVFQSNLLWCGQNGGWLDFCLTDASSIGLGHLVRPLIADGLIGHWGEVKALRTGLGTVKQGSFIPLELVYE